MDTSPKYVATGFRTTALKLLRIKDDSCEPEPDVAVRVGRRRVVQVERTVIRIRPVVRKEHVTAVEVLV